MLERYRQFTLRSPRQAAILIALVISMMIFALSIGYGHGLAVAFFEALGAGAISFVAFGLLRSQSRR
jgi:hypothetical protein